MTAEAISAWCLERRGAYEDYPFGPEPACFRVKERIFAELYPSRGWVTLKCEAMRGDFYRQQYPGAVTRGYHCPPVQQPYKNTICFSQLEDAILLEMLSHSYTMAVASLPKKLRLELAEEA